MTERNKADLELERWVHRSLRALPQRRAPLSLEARVYQELSRLASLPWWRRSFAHWPGTARAAFLILSVGSSALTFIGGARLLAKLAPMRGLTESLAWLNTTVETLGSLVRAVPSIWLYEGLAAAAL